MVKILLREERFLKIMKHARVAYLGKVLNFYLLTLKTQAL